MRPGADRLLSDVGPKCANEFCRWQQYIAYIISCFRDTRIAILPALRGSGPKAPIRTSGPKFPEVVPPPFRFPQLGQVMLKDCTAWVARICLQSRLVRSLSPCRIPEFSAGFFGRERKLNTDLLFSQTFQAPPGYPDKIPGYLAKKVWFPCFRKTYRTFRPPPHSRGRPPPHPKISGPKTLGLGSFFFSDLGANATVPRTQQREQNSLKHTAL